MQKSSPTPLLLSCFRTCHLSPTLFLQLPTGLFASWDALRVSLHTVGEGIIPECKSDHITSLLNTFQWLPIAESKHPCSALWALVIWPLIPSLTSPPDTCLTPLCSSHSELSMQIPESLISPSCECYFLPEMLSFHIFPNSHSSFRSSSCAVIL